MSNQIRKMFHEMRDADACLTPEFEKLWSSARPAKRDARPLRPMMAVLVTAWVLAVAAAGFLGRTLVGPHAETTAVKHDATAQRYSEIRLSEAVVATADLPDPTPVAPARAARKKQPALNRKSIQEPRRPMIEYAISTWTAPTDVLLKSMTVNGVDISSPETVENDDRKKSSSDKP